jgi:tRNA uracil 4-sulfurtransferase
MSQKMAETFVVHYSEIALKGKNRPEFVRMLKHNLHRSLFGLEPVISFKDGRLVISSTGGKDEIASRLSRVFGVAWFARTEVVAQDYGAMLQSVLGTVKASKASTFKVEVRRSDKSFGLSSGVLAAKLGSEVVDKTGMEADLTEPSLTVHVDVVRGAALVYSERRRGPGGLPLGSSGRVMHLFSGGIDSPAAAWLMMKRGCRPVYLHFYLAPTPDYAIQSKILGLIRLLSQYGGKSTLVLVPFSDYQLATIGTPGDLEPSLFRRFMRMTAELLAPHFRADGISTGDSLSQAASQTLWNLRAFDEGSSLPIFRPLLAYDKEEVVDLAKRLGTYEASLEEYKDCCAIITRHPKTRVKPETVSQHAEALGFGELAARSIERGTVVSYSPWGPTTKTFPLAQAMASRELILPPPGGPKAKL